MWIERVRDALDNKLAPCPLCGSPGEEQHEPKFGLKGEAISCSNDKCILHISYQSEAGKYVSRSQWKKVQSSVSEIREKIADDKAKKVADHNCIDLREPYALAYRRNGCRARFMRSHDRFHPTCLASISVAKSGLYRSPE